MLMLHRLGRLSQVVAAAIALTACTAQPASPLASPLAVATSPLAVETIAAEATPEMTPIWTLVTGGDLPAGVITQMARESLVEGGHGGGDAYALPARILIDYRVVGACEFGVAIYSQAPGTEGAIARLHAVANSEAISRTWAVQLPAGLYEISPGASDGCTYLITVRADPAVDPSGVPLPASTPVMTQFEAAPPAGVLQQTARSSLTHGGHGLGNFIELPASILIDYSVTGTCAFQVVIWTEAGGPDSPAVTMPLAVRDATVSGTWSVGLYPPGAYAVDPRGFDRCTYLLTVRTA